MAKQKRRKPKPQQRSAEPTVAQQREEWRKAKAEDEALAAGADVFLQKPFDPLELVSAAEDLLDADASVDLAAEATS